VPLDLIVEVGNSHEGSLGIAMSFVDMIASTGAKSVKFQMHIAEFESRHDEPFRKKFSLQDSSRFEYWERVSFNESEWQVLIDYTLSKGLEFICSPFSVEAASFLKRTGGIQRWKVGSGEATNFPLLDFMAESGFPIILSTGLVSWEELLKIRSHFVSRKAWDRVTLMHCVSMYPTPLEKVSLNLIDELRKLTSQVGFSDHSGDPATSLLAYSLGVELIEVHFTPHVLYFGPDTSSSLTTDQIRDLVSWTRKWDSVKMSPNSRDALFRESMEVASIFRKGIYWKRSLPTGHTIQFEDLAFLKPAGSIGAEHYESVVGKVTSCDVDQGNEARWTEMVESSR